MARSRLLSSLAAASLGVMLLGACSTDSLGERAVGFGLEQALDGQQDIDLDFDNDGGFSITTEDGSFAVNVDGDNGGIVFDSDEGSGAISFDQEGVTFASDDGTSGVFGAGDVPADWPVLIGVPQTMQPAESFFSSFASDEGSNVTGVFAHDPAEPFAEAVEARLAADGWEAAPVGGAGGSTRYSQWTKGDSIVGIADDGTRTTVTFTNP